jgi:DNA-binding NarL/FixJ family response regulator
MASVEKQEGGARARVVIVDSHPIVRRGLSALLAQADYRVCGEAGDAGTALKVILKEKPGVAIIDIALKNGSGFDLIKTLRRVAPEVRVLVLSIHDETLYAERALRAGAKGYLMKEEEPGCVIAAIERILDGQIHVSEAMAARILDRFAQGPRGADSSPLERLTDRELEVFEHIGHGHTTRQVAERLRISPKTVESYREHIKVKLGLRNASELVQRAVHWVDERESLRGAL